MATGKTNCVTTVTPDFETDQKGRNPELTGMHHDVWLFVQENPNCTRREIAKKLGLRSSSATARAKELIDRGLLMENGTAVDKLTGKTVKTLIAPEDYLHKAPRDRVRVNVRLHVDEDGNYHASASIVGGNKARKTAMIHAVMSKEITLIAPYPNEYRAAFLGGKLEVVSARDTLTNAKLIIDG